MSDDTAELLAFAVLDDNKRLIAERDRLRMVNAELLTALKDIENQSDEMARCEEFSHAERWSWRGMRNIARTAIAKAEGR